MYEKTTLRRISGADDEDGKRHFERVGSFTDEANVAEVRTDKVAVNYGLEQATRASRKVTNRKDSIRTTTLPRRVSVRERNRAASRLR